MKLLLRGPKFSRAEVNHLKHEYTVGRSLRHPNIIQIEEFGSTPDATFLVMELFQVLNLKQWLTQGVTSIAHLVEDIIRQTADALSYFHQHGWVHCDVKPDNLLVSDEGRVKLIDFSLSQKLRGKWGRWFSGKSKVQGTKSYMSPEQIRGQALDERSDIYSFACVIHELLAGKPPFTGTSANDLLMKHLRSRVPSLEAINKNVNPDFAQLVVRMLAKNPQQRPSSSTEFLEAIDNLWIFRRRPGPPSDEVVKKEDLR